MSLKAVCALMLTALIVLAGCKSEPEGRTTTPASATAGSGGGSRPAAGGTGDMNP